MESSLDSPVDIQAAGVGRLVYTNVLGIYGEVRSEYRR